MVVVACVLAFATVIAIRDANRHSDDISWSSHTPLREGFVDNGPLAPPTFKPCEIYYTTDKASCDAGSFLTSRAAYVASLADSKAATPMSAQNTVDAANFGTTIAKIDALPGSGAACKVTLPAPWSRVVSDPADDVYWGARDNMMCYVPGSVDTDYASIARRVPGAKVAATSQTFSFHAPTSTGPADPALSPYKRYEFDDLSVAAFTSFACLLPEVINARTGDARYDVGRAGWSTLMTFGVKAFGRTSMALTSAKVDGDLLKVMRGFYEESCAPDGNGATATLKWTPHLEAGAQVLRVQMDACGKPFADKTFDDKCVVGHPVGLKTYSLKPQPAAYGTTTDIRATKVKTLDQIKQFSAALQAAEAFLVLQQARYDNVLEILRRTLEAWELNHSDALQSLVVGAANTYQRGVFSDPTATPGVYSVVGAPYTTPSSKIQVDDSLLDSRARPPDQRYGPELPLPQFYLPNSTANTLFQAKGPMSISTAPALCPAGSHAILARLAFVNNNTRIKPIVGCINPATSQTTVVDGDPQNNANSYMPPNWTPTNNKNGQQWYVFM